MTNPLATVLESMPTVTPMRTRGGNFTPYQLEIRWTTGRYEAAAFQSYGKYIALRVSAIDGGIATILDRYNWDYSRTTTQYLKQFLGESLDTIREHVQSGYYSTEDLNV